MVTISTLQWIVVSRTFLLINPVCSLVLLSKSQECTCCAATRVPRVWDSQALLVAVDVPGCPSLSLLALFLLQLPSAAKE